MSKKANRRGFLALGAMGALGSCAKKAEKPPSDLGPGSRAVGAPSPHEKLERIFNSPTPATGSSRTPLQQLHGVITPASLHFERHHAGVPNLDPEKHELLVHGLVERELIFTVADLKRLPSVSRVYFVECAGNSGSEWKSPAPSAQRSHGLASCSEWTGVLLKTVLEEAGLKTDAGWIIAEGGDACLMARSVPVAKCLDDAMIAYAQNGEAIRPEQGYPIRLVLPGWEGNMQIKWLRRLHATQDPMHSREETSHYTDTLADGKSRQFTFELDAKSIITRPSGEQQLSGKGFHEITGLAWSGRGLITKVEVSTDAGKTWQAAEIQEPRHAKAFTRFRLPWTWDGAEVTIQSRATDETGYTQPTREELIAARGENSLYHYNGIKVWRIDATGKVNVG